VRKKRKASSEVPDSSLVEFGRVSTGKRDFPEWNILYILRIEQWKNNGNSFTKIGKLCLHFLNPDFLFKHPIIPILTFNMTISNFIY
jgi:hypothetical protein